MPLAQPAIPVLSACGHSWTLSFMVPSASPPEGRCHMCQVPGVTIRFWGLLWVLLCVTKGPCWPSPSLTHRGAADWSPCPLCCTCERDGTCSIPCPLKQWNALCSQIEIWALAKFKLVIFGCLFSLSFSYPLTVFYPPHCVCEGEAWLKGIYPGSVRYIWAQPLSPCPGQQLSGVSAMSPSQPWAKPSTGEIPPPPQALSPWLMSTCNGKINIKRRHLQE